MASGVSGGKRGSEQQLPDEQALFIGEVELAIAPPVWLNLLSKLYAHLQAIPDVKLLWTTSSREQETTITLMVEKSTPLVGMMTQIPEIKVTAEAVDKASSAKRPVASSLKTGGLNVTRIKLSLQEK